MLWFSEVFYDEIRFHGVASPLQEVAAEPSVALVFFGVGFIHAVGVNVIHYCIRGTEVGNRSDVYRPVFPMIGWKGYDKPESGIETFVVAPSAIYRSCSMVEMPHGFQLETKVAIQVSTEDTPKLGIPSWQIEVATNSSHKTIRRNYLPAG